MQKPETSRVALLTGCSSGIGKATAVALASSGWTVVATGRRPEMIGGIGAALTLSLDVTDDASLRSAFAAKLDALWAPVRGDRRSPYYSAYGLREAYMASVRSSDPGPGLVAATVLRALAAKKPKPRYLVASDPALKLLLRLPQGLRASLFASSLAAFSRSMGTRGTR